MFGRKKPPEITLAPTGFSVQGITIAWSEISAIKAFKLNLLTYDSIMFAFDTDLPPHHIELSEEWPGFQALAAELESRFEFLPDWWETVALPAFKTNETTLYQRA